LREGRRTRPKGSRTYHSRHAKRVHRESDIGDILALSRLKRPHQVIGILVAVFTLAFADAASLAQTFALELSKGRAFVAGARCDGSSLSLRTPCELLLVAPDGVTHSLLAEVVFDRPGPQDGVDLRLAPLDAAALGALRAFVESATASCAPAPPSSSDAIAERVPLLHVRLRGLPLAEQQRIAASGTLPERVTLERMYGATVWGPLLNNALLTVPEVARIARRGLPPPLLELIAGNAAWLAASEVQRALLSNPRSSAAIAARILAGLPRAELARVAQRTAYPLSVRQAAKRMLG
jgi:hypothetical protein